MQFEAPAISRLAIDDELDDAGLVGPELAHLSRIYRHSPRALIWRQPSSEWRLLIVLLPLASRLSLIGNPIFAQLARAWGLNVRFIGVDREQLVYDFRSLLSDRSLRLLIDALSRKLDPDLTPTFGPRPDDAAAPVADEALDVLFAALAGDLLTVLDRRRDDWGRHLLREHRLQSPPTDARAHLAPAGHALFDRGSRYPDFIAKLQEALRNDVIDTHFYGRVLRSIDARESEIEQRLARIIEANLDAATLSLLSRTPADGHLGCYNWLRLDPRHASARAYALTRLPAFASFFAESLVTVETLRPVSADDPLDDGTDAGEPVGPRVSVPTLDLRGLAARHDTAHSLRWSAELRRAIDAGQDRAMIEALAQRFAVGDNVIRRLWRERPAALGTPPTWQLTQILRRLNPLADRGWPADDTAWRELIASSIPGEAG
ncbi:MAG: hypothetical protein QM766_06500 [Burkholderiaceae bacterium]